LSSNERSGGILGGINLDRFDIVNFTIGTYYIRAVVFEKLVNPTWVLIIVYGAAQEDDKKIFLLS
jgi:hypothetical protein